MTQEERDNEVTLFIGKIMQQLPHFLDNKIMESFDVKFQYGDKFYQLALIQNGKVHGKDFEVSLN
ncbi:MAG: hypothetical protein AABY22_24325 [Nanoarchaeota archaeon]